MKASKTGYLSRWYRWLNCKGTNQKKAGFHVKKPQVLIFHVKSCEKWFNVPESFLLLSRMISKIQILVSGPAQTLTVLRYRLLCVLVGAIHETFIQQQI